MTEDRQRNSIGILAALLALVLLPLAAHLLFSWIGFTPTDDGFTLAYSRRLLDGEIPHRDFIMLRPFFSPLMHVPEVLLGGDYTFWISRLVVWFQLAWVSWIWIMIVDRFSNFQFGPREKFLITLIVFALTAHNFPIMAWHTIDGLLLSSLGLLLCLQSRWTAKFAGYVLLGLACLCKQSFIFMAPLVLVTLGDWRGARFWSAALLPALVYGIWLFFTGGLTDAVWQLTSRTGFFSVGIKTYLNLFVLSGVAYALIANWLISRSCKGEERAKSRLSQTLDVWLLVLIPWLLVVISLYAGIVYMTAFLLSGIVIGLAICFRRCDGKRARDYVSMACLALTTAWSVSLSEGYNTPALAAGALFITAAVAPFFRHSPNVPRSWRVLALGAGITQAAWGFARMNYTYRDRPARYLDKQLGDVFPGGRLIKTNANTYEFLADLRNAIAFAEKNGKRYLIIPDVPGYWVKSKQPNPLPIAWPHGNEISNRKNFDRLVASLEAGRSSTIVIAQKVEATTLSDGFNSLPENQYYAIVGYVRSRFTKVGETKCFELYR